MDIYFWMIAIALFVIFSIYFLIAFISTDTNQFLDKWARKTLWIWLPFYALQRLIKEVILRKK